MANNSMNAAERNHFHHRVVEMASEACRLHLAMGDPDYLQDFTPEALDRVRDAERTLRTFIAHWRIQIEDSRR